MKNRSRVFLIVLTTCFILHAQTYARAQSLLQDKLNFLKENLERHLTYTVRAGEGPEIGNTSLEAVSFEGCRITWNISSEFGQSNDMAAGLGDVKVSNEVSVDLSTINPAKTRIYVMEGMKKRDFPWSLALELTTRPGSPGFNLQMISNRNGRVTRMRAIEAKQYVFFFNIKDQLIAEEVAKTFHEASNICRSNMRRRR